MWHVSPESKIQLVNCKLSPKFPLGNLSLPEICVIYADIFWSLLFLLLSHESLPFSLKRTCFRRLSLSFGGFEYFAIRWYSDPHLKHFLGVRSVRLLSELPATRAFYFSCLILMNFFMQSDFHLHKKCTFSEQCFIFHYFYHNLSCCIDLDNQSVGMK